MVSSPKLIYPLGDSPIMRIVPDVTYVTFRQRRGVYQGAARIRVAGLITEISRRFRSSATGVGYDGQEGSS